MIPSPLRNEELSTSSPFPYLMSPLPNTSTIQEPAGNEHLGKLLGHSQTFLLEHVGKRMDAGDGTVFF